MRFFSEEYYGRYDSFPFESSGPVNATCSNDINGYQVMSTQLINDFVSFTEVKLIVRFPASSRHIRAIFIFSNDLLFQICGIETEISFSSSSWPLCGYLYCTRQFGGRKETTKIEPYTNKELICQGECLNIGTSARSELGCDVVSDQGNQDGEKLKVCNIWCVMIGTVETRVSVTVTCTGENVGTTQKTGFCSSPHHVRCVMV